MYRIMHLIGGAEKGGSRRQVISLARKLQESGYDADIVCLLYGPVYESARRLGLKVTVFPMKGVYDLRVISPLVKRMRSYDIVHTHGVRAGFVGRIAAWAAGVPAVVTTVHSSIDYDYRGLTKRLLYGFVDRLTMGFADRIITVSDKLKRELVGRGIPEHRLVTIYNSIDLEALNPKRTRSEIREELGIPAEAKLITTIGRMVAVKGHRYFLEASREIKKRCPDAYFMIVGDGPLYEETRMLAQELGLQDGIVFTGFRSDVPDLLAACDVFVLPSLMEGLPTALLEAMAMARPVVASRVGGIPELVTDGETGLLVEPKQPGELALAILRLLSDPAWAEKIARAGALVVKKKFSLDSMFRGICGVYQELLQKKQLNQSEE